MLARVPATSLQPRGTRGKRQGDETNKPRSDVVVIGVGNAMRGDDAVGILVARRIRELDHSIKVVEGSADATYLMEAWDNAKLAFIVDATRAGGEPGTVYHMHVGKLPIPARLFRYSTHNYDVSEAIELARALGKLPPSLIIYGIEGENFEAGRGLSDEVEEAAKRVTESVLAYARAAIAARS
jgi:hydrogenase maturation protease